MSTVSISNLKWIWLRMKVSEWLESTHRFEYSFLICGTYPAFGRRRKRQLSAYYMKDPDGMLYTYIIGNYNPSFRIVVCANFIHKCRDLQFKVVSERVVPKLRKYVKLWYCNGNCVRSKCVHSWHHWGENYFYLST